ncbi:hypothetical protein COHA_007692 [Chlorella ohadii]|uniref:Uncharacterized protein n=1 Tax=Chlorella ohadii TaxID=2649997 RepID=A0AAD5GZP0_9CHLO|nr:hypothetical protein COHA_007692 [Chlorella ohadii]
MTWGTMLLPLVVAALLSHAAAAAAAQLELPNPIEELPVIRFSRGERLEDLPGRSVLSPSGPRDSINITLEPATLVADEDGLQFTNGFYTDGESGGIHVFGPTLRIKAGEPYWIYLANQMYVGPNSTLGAANTYRDPAYTNLHTHGLHDSPGAFSQDTATEYQGSDNIFVSVPGKLKPSDEPARLAMNSSTPPDHLPGLHWYHPHYHGSSMLQTSTANGLIIVEDDEAWLPAENGCTEVWGLMQEVPDQILHLALLTFADPSAATLKAQPDEDSARDLDANYQYYSKTVQPSNVYCCNETNADNEASLPLLGSMANETFVLVNGGYEPVLTMEAGRYQRWRVVNTGYKGLVDLVVLDPATLLPTNSCDLQLLAKDGVYLMEIPRQVDHIFLVSGNRAELLVKCEGQPGDRFIVASGAELSPFGKGFTGASKGSMALDQPIVMTIELAAAEGPAHPEPRQKACTPLRPGYAPDLRDPALKAAGATDKLIKEVHGFDFTDKYSCTVDGEAFSFPDPEPLLMPCLKAFSHALGCHRMGHVPYAKATKFQQAKGDTIAKAVQRDFRLPVPPAIKSLYINAENPNKVQRNECMFDYPRGCQVGKPGCRKVAGCNGRTAKKNYDASNKCFAFLCDNNACRAAAGRGPLCGTKTGLDGGVGSMTEEDLQQQQERALDDFARKFDLDREQLRFVGEYCGAFNARHLGYPCQCGCGRLVTLQAGNIVRRHGDKLDRLPFLLDDCRTKMEWEEQYKLRLLGIDGVTPEIVETFKCCELRRTSADPITGNLRAYRGISVFTLNDCFRADCRGAPVLSGWQVDSRIKMGMPLECLSHNSFTVTLSGKRYQVQTFTEGAGLQVLEDELSKLDSFKPGMLHSSLATKMTSVNPGVSKFSWLPNGLHFIADYYATPDKVYEADSLLWGHRYKDLEFRGSRILRTKFPTEETTVQALEELAGGRGNRLKVGDGKVWQTLLFKIGYGESIKVVTNAGFESVTHVYNDFGQEGRIDYSEPHTTIHNADELTWWADNLHERLTGAGYHVPRVPMFADDDRLDKEKWDAAKNAVGNPLSWPKKATDQALITDYFGQGLAFLEKEEAEADKDEEDEEELPAVAAAAAAGAGQPGSSGSSAAAAAVAAAAAGGSRVSRKRSRSLAPQEKPDPVAMRLLDLR